MVEDIQSMLEEDVGGAQDSHHMEESVLVLMDQCWGGERAGQEVEGWGRGTGVETLQSLQS